MDLKIRLRRRQSCDIKMMGHQLCHQSCGCVASIQGDESGCHPLHSCKGNWASQCSTAPVACYQKNAPINFLDHSLRPQIFTARSALDINSRKSHPPCQGHYFHFYGAWRFNKYCFMYIFNIIDRFYDFKRNKI